jgi:hypothetical protein
VITCICPNCGGTWSVTDELAGEVVGCEQCGARTAAPFDLPDEGEWSPPEDQTLTPAELEAFKRGLVR